MRRDNVPQAKTTFATMDDYIASCPEQWQDMLQRVRAVILENAPMAQQRMSWQMPTFHYKHNLVHFALHKTHLGFYPGAEAMEAFAPEFERYKTSKGAVQFPLKEPIPYDLIAQVTAYRVRREQDA